MFEKIYYIKDSPIHGKGIFLNKDISRKTPIDVGIDFYFGWIPYITPKFGSLINHSYNPNCYLKWLNKKWYVCAIRPIKKHEEITLDYNRTPIYVRGPEPHYK